MAEQPVAYILGPVFTTFLGDEPLVRVEFWDGSSLGDDDAKATIAVRSVNAVRRVLWAPGELGLSRAFVAGDIEIKGDLYYALSQLMGISPKLGDIGVRSLLRTAAGAARLRAVGLPLEPPPEETVPRGSRHSKTRDARAISHHYDVGNEFYSLFLGKTMTYSCARFTEPGDSLDDAQRNKLDLVCRKLGLEPGMRFLDVGCGWGGLVLHAVQNYGVKAVGITLSHEQMQLARAQAEDAGVSSSVDVRLQDYRDLTGETFDAIASVGMFEHVGRAKLSEYFTTLGSVLRPGGRLLNHAIDKPSGAQMSPDGFTSRFVFPDGELQDIAVSLEAMQNAGFEVRDVESMREHYAKTLRYWVANLENQWSRAVQLVGENRARVWMIYMAGSAVSFDANRINIHQTLAVKTPESGESGMPLTRHSFV